MMSDTLLFVGFTEPDGSLSAQALQALGAAVKTSAAIGAPLVAGLVGASVAAAATQIAQPCTRVLGVQGDAFASSRYATDAAGAEALAKAAAATIVVAAGTSRAHRALPGVAQRLGARVDTHVTALTADNGAVGASRWYYRQRMEASLSRDARPWVILVEPGAFEPWSGSGAAGPPLELVALEADPAWLRTRVTGFHAPEAAQQTIRPDADLLFVAGAGWTKKQGDGQVHVREAETLITQFLARTQASLGSSKSLVDLSGEGHDVLPFLTHLNQVGQTGSTPRHPKGLATCCHGEEPHVVGWRFITERRAVNLNPSCGWAQGKADVLYVADAFQVMAKVNELLGER
jgi:electron transfer flavoprotein alpha subunit